MKILTFLLSAIIELYTMILLLHVWIQWVRYDFYDPFTNFIAKSTQKISVPLRRFIPSIGSIDNASLLAAFVLCLVRAVVLFMMASLKIIIWMIALLIFLKTIGLLVFLVLLITTIMNLKNQERNSIDHLLSQLTEPLLRPLRVFLPSSIGEIELSPILLMLLLYIVNIGITKLLCYTTSGFLLGLWTTL